MCSDGTAEVVNNLLRHAALRRVTNACQRNGPREVRAGLLTSAPPSDRESCQRLCLMVGGWFPVYLSLLTGP